MSDRYEREIEEILRQAGDTGLDNDKEYRRRRLLPLVLDVAYRSLKGRPWTLTSGRVLLIALGVLVLAAILSSVTNGLGPILGLVGLVIFIVGYAMFFIKPPRPEKRWRGQPIEYETPWWTRFLRKK